jgi:hypothetical protein
MRVQHGRICTTKATAMHKQTHVRMGSSLTLPLISSGSSTRLMRPLARWTCGTNNASCCVWYTHHSHDDLRSKSSGCIARDNECRFLQ